ncbi:MAG: DUF3788 family protein, partial [Oscillospiraceae bacterium]
MDISSTDIEALIGAEKAELWRKLTAAVDELYDVDKIWNKGFGDWVYEYKYRRGGKTLCSFYAKQGVANILIIFGKNEREKFELQRESFSEQIQALFNSTKTYHDGKWIWVPIDDG